MSYVRQFATADHRRPKIAVRGWRKTTKPMDTAAVDVRPLTLGPVRTALSSEMAPAKQRDIAAAICAELS
jgi:hypothetical protein